MSSVCVTWKDLIISQWARVDYGWRGHGKTETVPQLVPITGQEFATTPPRVTACWSGTCRDVDSAVFMAPSQKVLWNADSSGTTQDLIILMSFWFDSRDVHSKIGTAARRLSLWFPLVGAGNGKQSRTARVNCSFWNKSSFNNVLWLSFLQLAVACSIASPEALKDACEDMGIARWRFLGYLALAALWLMLACKYISCMSLHYNMLYK